MGERILGSDWNDWRSSKAQNTGAEPVAKLAHEPIAVSTNCNADFIADLGAALDALQQGCVTAEEPPADSAHITTETSAAGPDVAASRETIHERLALAGQPPNVIDRKALACGVVGFLAGALAWHLVGFWGFVAAIAFNGDVGSGPHPAITRSSAALSARTGDIVTGSITPSQGVPSGGCVALAMDRQNRDVEHIACRHTLQTLRHDELSEKGDRLTAFSKAGDANAPTEIQASSATGPEAPDDAPADDRDFDLQLRPGP